MAEKITFQKSIFAEYFLLLNIFFSFDDHLKVQFVIKDVPDCKLSVIRQNVSGLEGESHEDQLCPLIGGYFTQIELTDNESEDCRKIYVKMRS